MATLQALPSVTACNRVGNNIVVDSDSDVRALATAAVVASGASLLGASSENRTLEQIYLRYFAGQES
jgi:hypothetical protein